MLNVKQKDASPLILRSSPLDFLLHKFDSQLYTALINYV